ncbi:hypothetical protein [Allorhodopirellula solitaria]|uniref:Uncharacterized protein n=1 Tax=Allorhodopirellula solitaria TaxID=2527987 RepID=A0A5C5YDL5_9BACT|nr:hypothetical protein [Allorhodopirellula solitaria]TWT72893.1 hypothetical protein CA85_13540 [Allorhodopirellula solitaria]
MLSAIELHDTIVTHCGQRDGDLVLRLSPALLHRAPTSPGFEAGDVFMLDLDVVLRHGAFREPFTELPTKLQGGSITVRSDRYDNCVPFPLDIGGPVTVALIDYNGRDVELTANAISLVPTSSEIYLESFPGSDA